MNIVVIGAGNSGLMMSAHFKINNHRVCLWNRSFSTIEKLQQDRVVNVKGILNSKVVLDVVTDNISEAMRNAELVVITTPSNTHADIARLLAPFVNNEITIVLNPGRTLGAVEFRNILSESNTEIPNIGETQTIIYTCRKINYCTVILYAFKRNVRIGFLNIASKKEIFSKLPKCYSEYLVLANNVLETSLGNVGAILHCAPVLLNAGWIENPETTFKYYYTGITPTISIFLEKLDKERIKIAKYFNIKIPSIIEWFEESYGVTGNNLYECLKNNFAYETIDAPKSLNHRYLNEDIRTGLVPLEAIGKATNISVKITTLLIDLAEELMNCNYRESGRNLSNIDINEIRQFI